MSKSRMAGRLEKTRAAMNEVAAAERDALAEIGSAFLEAADGNGRFLKYQTQTFASLRDVIFGTATA